MHLHQSSVRSITLFDPFQYFAMSHLIACTVWFAFTRDVTNEDRFELLKKIKSRTLRSKNKYKQGHVKRKYIM